MRRRRNRRATEERPGSFDGVQELMRSNRKSLGVKIQHHEGSKEGQDHGPELGVGLDEAVAFSACEAKQLSGPPGGFDIFHGAL